MQSVCNPNKYITMKLLLKLLNFLSLNDKIKYVTHDCLFEKETAISIIDQYPFSKQVLI